MAYFKAKVTRKRGRARRRHPAGNPAVQPKSWSPMRATHTMRASQIMRAFQIMRALRPLWPHVKSLVIQLRWRNLGWRGKTAAAIGTIFSAMVLLPTGIALATHARGDSSLLAWMHTQDARTPLRVYRMETGDVVTVPLSDYLVDVLAAEVDPQAPMDALQAAAIAARTYAVHAIVTPAVPQPTFAQARGGDVTDNGAIDLPWLTAAEQEKQFKSKLDTYTVRLQEAVQSTDGQVLTYHGQVASAFTFRVSPVQTRDAKDVFGKEIPYLRSIPCPDDAKVAVPAVVKLPSSRIASALQLQANTIRLSDFHITAKDKLGFAETVAYQNRTWNGQDFARLLNIQSADFDMQVVGDVLQFTLRGIGSDVGMSLHEAQVMAANHKSWKEILGVFYPGTQIENDLSLLQIGVK